MEQSIYIVGPTYSILLYPIPTHLLSTIALTIIPAIRNMQSIITFFYSRKHGCLIQIYSSLKVCNGYNSCPHPIHYPLGFPKTPYCGLFSSPSNSLRTIIHMVFPIFAQLWEAMRGKYDIAFQTYQHGWRKKKPWNIPIQDWMTDQYT